MKKTNWFYFSSIFLFLGLVSCSNSSSHSTTILKKHLLREDLDLGEYQKVIDSDTLVTVNRTSSALEGLVLIHLANSEIEVLDSKAKEARDIQALKSSKGPVVAYRLDDRLYFYSSGSSVKLPPSVKRLRAIDSWKDQFLIAYDDSESSESKWMKLSASGQSLGTGTLTGSVRTISFGKNEDSRLLVLQTEDGLSTAEFNYKNSDIVSHLRLLEADFKSSYVSARSYLNKDHLGIFAFDDEKGILQFFLCKDLNSPCSKTLVDGIPYSSQRGHDSIAFEYHGKPASLYADVRDLKLRRAWMVNDDWNRPEWKSEELPLQGAVGFYPQLVKENPGSKIFTCHNFRTSHDGQVQTFHDLAVFEIPDPFF